MYLLDEKIFPVEFTPGEIRELKQIFGIRRMPEYFLSLLGAVHRMELPPEDKENLGVIYASHLGPVKEVRKYVEDLLTYASEECSPALFSQSVFNAPVACLTNHLDIHGPCLSVCGFQDIIKSPVLTAGAWLQSGYCEKVLLIFSDENSGIAAQIAEMTGVQSFRTQHLLLLTENADNKNIPGFTPEKLIEHIRVQHQ